VTAIRLFRWIALAEGASYLALLAIGMPLKYGAGEHLPVKILGWAHGVLFIAYAFAAAPLFLREGWPWSRAPGVAVAALLPFGTFVMERKWLASAR
jgi:integral membrane protein